MASRVKVAETTTGGKRSLTVTAEPDVTRVSFYLGAQPGGKEVQTPSIVVDPSRHATWTLPDDAAGKYWTCWWGTAAGWCQYPDAAVGRVSLLSTGGPGTPVDPPITPPVEVVPGEGLEAAMIRALVAWAVGRGPIEARVSVGERAYQISFSVVEAAP